MKYQFTVEGSKPQTIYHKVTLLGPTPEEGIMWKAVVSTPLTHMELDDFITARLLGVPEGWHCWVEDAKEDYFSWFLLNAHTMPSMRTPRNMTRRRYSIRISSPSQYSCFPSCLRNP